MIKNLLDLVEIRTKVASVLPFLTGTFIALKIGYAFKCLPFVLMFFALLLIDMGTTGLNNLFDYKRALLKEGYHYEVHNPIGAGQLSERSATLILIFMLLISALLGLTLVFFTHYWVLFLGMLSFGMGIMYSAGPLPISRTPLGEIMSGVFMGGLIPTIAAIIHIPSANILTFNVQGQMLHLAINTALLLNLAVYALPLTLLIGNIMLANNTCDIEEDLVNHRYTLPVLIGQKKATRLFMILFLMAYLIPIIGVISGLLPFYHAAIFLSLPITFPLVRQFTKTPIKAKTFVNAVKTFVIYASFNLLLLIINYLLS